MIIEKLKLIKCIPSKIRLSLFRLHYRFRVSYNKQAKFYLESGFNLVVDKNMDSHIQLKGDLSTRRNVILRVDKGGKIIVGDKCFINSNCNFSARKSILIGDNCMFANNVVVIDHDHDYINGVGFIAKKIVIEDDVWIAANVVILKGVHIGRGSVVAAGSVVTNDIPPYTVWGGIPAKQLRRIRG